MRVRFVKAAAAASLLALSVTACGQGSTTKAGNVQPVALEGKVVTASGCARPVESTSCIVVRGPGGGYYDISSASPAPDPSKGVAVSLRGRDNGKNTECGRQLDNVTWSYLKIQCAAAATAETPTEKAG